MKRMTRQRIAVLSELQKQEGFRSAQQVHEDLGASDNRVGLATVYRNLQALAADGQLDTIRADDGEVLYRRCEKDAHHHHLVCRGCGTVIEVAPPDVESWVADVSKEHGFLDIYHSIEISGICLNCQEHK